MTKITDNPEFRGLPDTLIEKETKDSSSGSQTKPLCEKRICIGEVKLGTLNSDLPYYVYPAKDVKNSTNQVKERLKEKFCGNVDGSFGKKYPCNKCINCKFIDLIFQEEIGEFK